MSDKSGNLVNLCFRNKQYAVQWKKKTEWGLVRILIALTHECLQAQEVKNKRIIECNLNGGHLVQIDVNFSGGVEV